MESTHTYESLLTQGSRELNTGHPKKAALSFMGASKLAEPTSTPEAIALAKAGIAYRLLREYAQALEVFGQAIPVLSTHQDSKPYAVALRDRAMVYVQRNDGNDLEKAEDDLVESAAQLAPPDGTFSVEWLATLGFTHRVKLLRATTNAARRQASIDQLIAGLGCLLRGSELYALNTLPWAMKGLGLGWRLGLAPLGIGLALHQRNFKRVAEVVVLAIGGWPLHKRLKARL